MYQPSYNFEIGDRVTWVSRGQRVPKIGYVVSIIPPDAVPDGELLSQCLGEDWKDFYVARTIARYGARAIGSYLVAVDVGNARWWLYWPLPQLLEPYSERAGIATSGTIFFYSSKDRYVEFSNFL